MDEGNVQALIGVIKCQLMMGKLDEAEQQLEFLNEIQASMGKSTELLFLGALLTWRQKGDREVSGPCDACVHGGLCACVWAYVDMPASTLLHSVQLQRTKRHQGLPGSSSGVFPNRFCCAFALVFAVPNVCVVVCAHLSEGRFFPKGARVMTTCCDDCFDCLVLSWA